VVWKAPKHLQGPDDLAAEPEDDHATFEDAAGHNGPGPWWFGHDYPERPSDRYTIWSWNCDACMLHLIADAALHGDKYASSVRGPEGDHDTTVQGTLAEARAWRAEHDMRMI